MERNLFNRDQVPEHFKELFIVSGYRLPGCSLVDCCLSVFKLNNETLNFWTHFLPAMYFWHMTYRTFTAFDALSDTHTWPLLAYMSGVCIFPFVSAVAHAFNTMSERARHICFFLDYAALGIFTVGCAIAYKAYIFPTSLIGGLYHQLFLPIAAIFAVASLFVTCQSRFMPNNALKKAIRTCAFALPYAFGSVPMIYRILGCDESECTQRALRLHSFQLLFAALSTLIYMAHIPERLWPGRFDIIGHSHQFFHVFTIVAVYLQVNGLTLDMLDRRDELVACDATPTPVASLTLMLAVLLIDVIVLHFFISQLYQVTPGGSVWYNLYGPSDSRTSATTANAAAANATSARVSSSSRVDGVDRNGTSRATTGINHVTSRGAHRSSKSKRL